MNQEPISPQPEQPVPTETGVVLGDEMLPPDANGQSVTVEVGTAPASPPASPNTQAKPGVTIEVPRSLVTTTTSSANTNGEHSTTDTTLATVSSTEVMGTENQTITPNTTSQFTTEIPVKPVSNTPESHSGNTDVVSAGLLALGALASAAVVHRRRSNKQARR